jgi:hyperosmotically inducible protein
LKCFNSPVPSLSIALSVAACGLMLASPARAANTGANDDVAAGHDSQTTETKTTTKRTKTTKSKHAEESSPAPAADNTGTNKRDRDGRAVTADQQKNSKSDVELAAEIRRAVVGDKSLSTNAHNIKIIVQDGQVTLKGPVASKAEKVTVEKKAADVLGTGAGRVVSEIAIAP